MSSSRRLFFAFPLPAALQQRVIRWHANAFLPEAGRPMAAANLHLTLAFLSDVTAQKQQALTRLADRITQPGFSMRLDFIGHWLLAVFHPVAIPSSSPSWAFNAETFALYQSVLVNGRPRFHPLKQWPLAPQGNP